LLSFYNGPVTDNLENVMKSVARRGEEGIIATRVLALISLNTGPLQTYTRIETFFMNVITNPTDDHEFLGASIAALAFIMMTEKIDEQGAWQFLNALETILESADEHPPALVIQTLKSFTLVYDKISTAPTQDAFNDILDFHMLLLDSDTLEVRIQAGENIAAILEHRQGYLDDVF
jgi:hypothetical protein